MSLQFREPIEFFQGSTLPSYLSKVNLVLVLLMLVAILGLGWYSQSLKGTVDLQAAQLVGFSTALDTANKSISETNDRLLVVEAQRVTHESKVRSIGNSIDKAKSDLDALKKREATIVAKSGLVEIKINKAFIKQQEKMACITGNETLCAK